MLTTHSELQAASVAAPTGQHLSIARELMQGGVDVLIEKPLAATLAEAEELVALAARHKRTAQVGHLERFNPAVRATVPLLTQPMFFEVHRLSVFTPRSLDVDVVLDLMIHDLDIVQWLVGEDIEAISVHAVGIPILTNRVDAANARIEFATGAVANITASRVGTEKIRKMRFFQPQDYIVLDYATNHASISNLAPSTQSPWPGVRTQVLEVKDVEPLRAEIESFIEAAATGSRPIVSGEDGRRALSLALRTLEEIHQHTVKVGGDSLLQKA